MLPRINMVAEQYLTSKANTNFTDTAKPATSENQIADRREFYNAASTNFNKAIQMIPSNIVASVKGCVHLRTMVR